MSSLLHISRGLEACVPEASPENILHSPGLIISPTRMRPPLSCSHTAPLVGLLWLGFACYLAQAWAWGPYNSNSNSNNNEWKSYGGLDTPALMHRAALPAPSYSVNSNSTHTTGANATGAVPLSTARPSAATNSSLDTCGGETFNVQVSQEAADDEGSGMFNGWWLKLSGDMVLFTSQRARATGFGVDRGTRHLCVPRAGQLPRIAVVETGLDTSPLYLLDANFSKGYQPEYEPLVCSSLAGNASQLTCGQGSRTDWSGCGLQLEIGAGSYSNATEGGLSCSGVALHAFQT